MSHNKIATAFEVPDDDRIVFFAPSLILKKDDDAEPLTFAWSPTDDPDRYRLTVTAPAPRFYIKRAELT